MRRDQNINKFILEVCNANLKELSLNDKFALKLKYIYLCLDISQLNFSLFVGLNLSYFNDLIRGKKSISLIKLESICKALKISTIELLNFDVLYLIQKERRFIVIEPFSSIKTPFKKKRK